MAAIKKPPELIKLNYNMSTLPYITLQEIRGSIKIQAGLLPRPTFFTNHHVGFHTLGPLQNKKMEETLLPFVPFVYLREIILSSLHSFKILEKTVYGTILTKTI